MPTLPDFDPAYWRDADVFGYARKSLVLGEYDPITITKQDAAIREAYAALELTKPLRIFYDAHGHRSGRHEHTRPDWMQLKVLLSASKKAILLIFEQDRMSRSVRDTAALVDMCRAAPQRYRIILIRNRFDSAKDGWGAREIKQINDEASDAQYESDKAAERMTAAIKVLKARLVYWGTTPYGAKRVGQYMNARMEHAETAPDVLELGRLWAQPGASYQTTAQALNAQGRHYLNRKGLPSLWDAARVRQIIGNTLFYLGHVIPRGGHAKRRLVRLSGDGSLVERYAAAYNAKPSPHITPIWDEELGERIIAKRLTRQTSGRKPGQSAIFLLTPIAYHKGQQLRAQTVRDLHFYATRQSPRVSFSAGDVDAQLITNLRGIKFPPLIIRHIGQVLEDKYGASGQRETKKRLESATAQIENLVRMQANPRHKTAEDVFEKLMAEAIQERDTAKAALTAPSDVERLLGQLNDLGATIAAMTPAQQRGILHSMFERIELDESGEVSGFKPRAWVHHAFAELLNAWEKLPTMTPTGFEPVFKP